MRGQIWLYGLMLVALPASSQVAPSAAGGSPTSQMMTPPPISNAGYSSALNSETRSNYIRGEIAVSAAYIDNLYADSTSPSLSEETISINPSIALDSTTARQQISLAYRPGFTLYTPSSELNEIDHNMEVKYTYRFTPYFVLNAFDVLQDSSIPAESAITGSPNPVTSGITVPYARRLTNSASVEATIQTDMNVMIGVSGGSMMSYYPAASQATGLSDSNSRTASAFYNRRLAITQYCGINYQYSDTLTYPASGRGATRAQTVMGFYTFYLNPEITASLSGGAQYYEVHQPLFPSSNGWGPMFYPSMSWQKAQLNLSANYYQLVTSGGGASGANHSRGANANLRWRPFRAWTTEASVAYAVNKSISQIQAENSNGHSFSGIVSLERTVGKNWDIRFHYTRFQQSYSNISAIAANPESNREELSIVWRFDRPLGR